MRRHKRLSSSFALGFCLWLTGTARADYTMEISSPVINQNGWKVGDNIEASGTVNYIFWGGDLAHVALRAQDDSAHTNITFDATINAGLTWASWAGHNTVPDCSMQGFFYFSAIALDSDYETVDGQSTKAIKQWLKDLGPGSGMPDPPTP
ncbi:hypothetical protein [Singulisphaera sp. PoT]|uniref:hypothetical protein n=1 Tax=Singulisphaera sp. PoT TaxID=3411797 RepID=UPI003BF555CA